MHEQPWRMPRRRERGNTFDPNNLPFTKTEKDEVKDCLDAEKKAETCSHCRWKCGRVMKKGIKYYYSFTESKI